MKKFTIACNWDPNLIEGLKQYSHRVKHIFGKTRTDVFSGGRAANQVVELEERKKAEDYIKQAKEAGLTFNYLMNGVILHDNPNTRKRIREDLKWIVESGVEWVTVSIPWLAEIIRDKYPNLNINVSVFAHVKTPEDIRKWKELGAKSICLDRHLVRNFPQLKRLREADKTIEYTLLVNDPCRLNCSIERIHDYQMSEASISGKEYFHCCSFSCLKDFISHPEKIIGSTYIRPEDLELYDGLVDCFKIVDRNRTTKFILNAVKAYTNEKYDGNLLDLMSLFSYYDRKHAKPTALNPGDLSIKTIDRFWKDLPSMINLFIDNRKMDGYIQKMQKDCEYQCDRRKTCLDYTKLISYDKKAAEIVKANIDLILVNRRMI